jgi:N6-L-threonylcarbamoyladenine synthase
MIAWAGIERIRSGATRPDSFIPRPRWPLDERAAALIGSGKRGAKG